MSVDAAAPAPGRRSWESLVRRTDRLLDPLIALVAIVLALASLLATDVDTIDPRVRDPDALAVVATAIAAGSLAWRRTCPMASYSVFVTGALVVSGSYHYIGLLSVLMLFSLFSLTTYGTRRQALGGLGMGIASFLVLGWAGVPDLRTKDVLLGIALLVASWAVAEALRSRREQQRERVRAAVTEERLRIARELHDVVAHSMSLIAVQAGVGAHVIRADPASAERALDVIADTSRRALEQTRSMLGMLREEDEAVTRPPTQGLDDLPALIEDVRAAGLAVELVRSGRAADVDPAVSLAAYRIVQESLTNVIKHSASSSARVVVELTGTGLDLDTSDPGPTRAAARVASAGHGLTGLGERARLVGGTVTYGPHGDGFRVHATLPVGSRR